MLCLSDFFQILFFLFFFFFHVSRDELGHSYFCIFNNAEFAPFLTPTQSLSACVLSSLPFSVSLSNMPISFWYAKTCGRRRGTLFVIYPFIHSFDRLTIQPCSLVLHSFMLDKCRRWSFAILIWIWILEQHSNYQLLLAFPCKFQRLVNAIVWEGKVLGIEESFFSQILFFFGIPSEILQILWIRISSWSASLSCAILIQDRVSSNRY